MKTSDSLLSFSLLHPLKILELFPEHVEVVCRHEVVTQRILGEGGVPRFLWGVILTILNHNPIVDFPDNFIVSPKIVNELRRLMGWSVF